MSSRIAIAATLATVLALPTAANAFELKHSGAGELVRWHRSEVGWTLDRSVHLVPGGEDAVASAVDAWTERAGGPALSVAKTDASLEPGLDGTSAVFFAEGGFAPAGSALAVTILSFDDRTGEVLDADIVMNGKYQLAPVSATATHPTSASDPGAETYDVGRIVAHEMGHALGLSDEPARKDALMYPYVARAVSLDAAPATDDLDGLKALYAGAAGSQGTSADSAGATGSKGCTGATIASSGPRAPWTTYAGVGLALGALAIARGVRRGRQGVAGCTALAAAALAVVPPLDARPSPATSWVNVHAPSGVARPARDAIEAKAVVTSVRTSASHGIFRTEIDLATTACAAGSCPSVAHATVWGGTMDGVRQVVGGALVPAAGERVVIEVDANEGYPAGFVRAMKRMGE